MSYNFKIGELKENARYTVSTVDKWDGSTNPEEMSGAGLKSFANGCAHLYDIHAEEISEEEKAPNRTAGAGHSRYYRLLQGQRGHIHRCNRRT